MEKQDVRITIRCTKNQKEAIERKAKKSKLSVSKYMINKSLQKKSNPYKTDKEKSRMIALISMKEAINQIERIKQVEYISLSLITELDKIKEQEERLWQSL